MTATEAEELAKKIIRAEWAIIKGWVPEIVANEVAGQLCEAIRPILSEQAQQLAALRAEVAAKDKQLHCMELRAKSAEAIAGVPGEDITRPACDCCEHSGPTVQYHDAAGYLCGKCESKVMSARESVKRHLDREAELEAEVARLMAEVERWQSAASGYATDNAEMSHQLAVTNERLAAAERLVERGKSLAQWVLMYSNNGRLQLGVEDLAYVQRIVDDAQGWLPAGEAKGVQS